MKTKAKFWYNKYKYYSDKLNALISKSKKSHLRKYFEGNYNDSKKTWQKINELLHHINKQKESIFLNEEGSLVIDPRAVASKFNNYFVNVAKNLLKGMGEASNQYQDYLKSPCEHFFFLMEIEPIETLKLLKNLNPKKFSDIYGIPPKLAN